MTKNISMCLKIFILASLFSCSDDPVIHNKEAVKEEVRQTISSKPPASFSDTLVVNYTAVVFYSPDPKQLSLIKAVTNPGVFDAMTHEYSYLLKNAHTVIQKNHSQIKVVEAKDARFILFKTDKMVCCIDLNTKMEPYGLFAFNMINEPRQVDLANVDTELHFYFAKPD